MSIDAMNFNSVEVCSAPTFKRSLSHQFKKLMCYNRHLNRGKVVLSSSTVDIDLISQPGNNRSAAVYSSAVQTDILRNSYEKNNVFLQNKLPPAIDGNMPNQIFGDIVKGMMTMPELPPFGSADIQQVVRLCDLKTEKRAECERSSQNRCRGHCNNDGTNGSYLSTLEGNYRRNFPPPSGADKLAFLDFPSPAPEYRQRRFVNNGMEPNSPSVGDDCQTPSLFPLERAKQTEHRNSAFEIYQKPDSGKDKNRTILDDSSCNYHFDFPVPSGADKLSLIDCMTGHPEQSISLDKLNGMPSHHISHSDLTSPFFEDDFSEDLSKHHGGMQEQIPQLINCNQHIKPDMQNYAHSSPMSNKRNSCCNRQLNDVTSSCSHSHRKHLSSCNRKNLQNLMDTSSKQDNNLNEFQIQSPYNLENSIHSPASTINSSDISFDLSQGPDFPQSKQSTSVPQRRGPGRPRKPENERKRKPTKSIPLWKFLLNMLHDPATCPELVRWEDTSKGTFRIVRSDQVAAKWGMRKDNTKMNYEKFSRAMRYYYKQHIFEAVPGKRLVYQFGRAAKDWRPKNMENPNFDH